MANCASCSAPLPRFDPVCTYCGTRNRVDLQGVHEYTVVAPDSGRECPRCAVELQTIDLGGESPFLIEQCGRCHGLFFDPGEVEALLQRSVSNVFEIDYQKIQAMTEAEGIASVRYVKCPVCGTIMNRINFGSRSGVVVDVCKGHGVWLDGGELRQLLEWKKAGGQLLHEQVRADRAREEAKRDKERAELARALAQSGAPAGSMDELGWDLTRGGDLAELVVGLVGRLFR